MKLPRQLEALQYLSLDHVQPTIQHGCESQTRVFYFGGGVLE